MGGDPHILTVDGLRYDYNGLGEYWLVVSEVFSLQGRTLQGRDVDGNPTQTAVFGAFAAKQEARTLDMGDGGETVLASVKIFVELNQARDGQWEVL